MRTELLDAARGGNVTEITRLLSLEDIDIEAAEGRGGDFFKGYAGYTPLLYAAHFGKLPAVKRLLESKASMTAKASGNKGLLYLTVFNGGDEIIRYLYEQNPAEVKRQLNSATSDGRRPLHATVINSCGITAQLLMNLGADRNLRDLAGQTAADFAKGYPVDRSAIVPILLYYIPPSLPVVEPPILPPAPQEKKSLFRAIVKPCDRPVVSLGIMTLGFAMYYANTIFNDSEASFTKKLGALLLVLAFFKFIAIDCGRVCGVIGEHGDRFFRKSVEFIDAAKMVTLNVGYATTVVSTAIRDLGNTTGQVLVAIQNEHTHTLQGIRGEAQLVARAIQRGIDDGKFQPTAQAQVHIGKITLQENNAPFGGCLTM